MSNSAGIIMKQTTVAGVAGLVAAALLAAGCSDSADRRLAGFDTSSPTTVTRISGLGKIQTADGVMISFDLDVRSDLTGRLTVADSSDIRPDGSVGTLRVDPTDAGTAITAFRTSSSTCSDPSRGVEFDGTGREDTGGLVGFTVAACDNGPSGSGLDIFRIAIPSEQYDRSGPVVSGDIAESSDTSSGGGGTVTTISGVGSLGPGPARIGGDRRDFDFDVASSLSGRVFYHDWSVLRPDGTTGTLTVDSDPATKITAFRTSSTICTDPARGVEFDGVGRVNTGGDTNPAANEWLAFSVAACDNGPAGSGTDLFWIRVPGHDYSAGPDVLSSGDLVKSDGGTPPPPPPPTVDASRSSVTAFPTTITAGSGSSTITVTARDANGHPVSGATVVLAATGSGNTLVQSSSPTDASGVATGSLSSTSRGSKTVSATISGVAVTQTATVKVTRSASQ